MRRRRESANECRCSLQVPPKVKGQKPIIKTKQVACDSFFNFFSPPDLEELEELQEDEVRTATRLLVVVARDHSYVGAALVPMQEEEMHELIQSDFEIGAAFRERLVPHAVVRASPISPFAH